MLRRALAIDEASYGPDHPNVATDLNNLAPLLRNTNRLSEAEPIYRRALAIFEASYGPDHPAVATNLNNLAELLRTTNRLSEAEPMYRRALAIDEASYGLDHSNVATNLNNLALLLRDTNRLSEAEPMFRRALVILARFELATGHGHPNLKSFLDNYVQALIELGRTEADIDAAFKSIWEDASELQP
jgi:tetratricopeptide (TPR) repeat protein